MTTFFPPRVTWQASAGPWCLAKNNRPHLCLSCSCCATNKHKPYLPKFGQVCCPPIRLQIWYDLFSVQGSLNQKQAIPLHRVTPCNLVSSMLKNCIHARKISDSPMLSLWPATWWRLEVHVLCSLACDTWHEQTHTSVHGTIFSKAT